MIQIGEISSYFVMPHPPIIIPEIGKGEEKKISKTAQACDTVAEIIASLKPDTIVVVTPHGPLFSDAVAVTSGKTISGSFAKFGAPQLRYEYQIDQHLSKAIVQQAAKQGVFSAEINPKTARKYGLEYQLDHGSLVPLHFIDQQYRDYQLVHITYGLLPKLQLYSFGRSLKQAVENSRQRVVFIASGDLSHKLSAKGPYEYSPYGAKYDRGIIDLLVRGDVPGIFDMDPNTVEAAGECGMRSFYIMLGAMNSLKISGRLLSYEDTFGVGYGVISFQTEPTDIDTYTRIKEQIQLRNAARATTDNPYVRLARESLTHYLAFGSSLSVPDYVPEEMLQNQHGVFVSLKKEGQLRGCIGTIFPTTANVAREIIKNSVDAGLHDPRFSPVSGSEMDEIDISVNVLSQPQKADKAELNPQKYGIVVRSGSKTGLLLPALPGVETVEQQLTIALKKAHISPRADYTIEKFEVIRHK